MMVKDFSFRMDENNTEQVEFIENLTKHASPDYPQSPEASFQKCLLLEEMDVQLQSSKSFCRVILPKYVQPVYFICLVCQIRPGKFRTRDSQ